MRRAVLILGPAALAALGLLWLLGGFDALSIWATEGQRAAQNALASALRRLRSGEPGALSALMGIAFTYGFLHAAGPGHGKLLIGGYGAARRVSMLRLTGIALAAAFAQASAAVLLVGIGMVAFEQTREQLVGLGEGAMAAASAAAIAAIGVWLALRGARGLAKLLPGRRAGRQEGTVDVCAACGHAHGPSAAEVAGITGWRDAALLVGAVAMRPCTGALFLLILTWRMDILGAGIAGTYAMGLGTASVTVIAAALAVFAREAAYASAGWLGSVRTVAPVLELAVGAAVALLAVSMLLQA